MSSDANYYNSQTSGQATTMPTDVGSLEMVQPDQMNRASRYLEEQYPKYYYEPDNTGQLPEPTQLPASQDGKRENDTGGNMVASRKTVLGIRRSLFVAVLAIALIVVAAAVGGGVGGSMASKNSKSEAAALTSAVDQEDSTEALEATSTPSQASTATVQSTTITETPTGATGTKTETVTVTRGGETTGEVEETEATRTTGTTKTTKTTKQTVTSTEVCAEGTVADGETQNYLGLCKFCCGYGYCPPGPCTCVAYGKAKETPPVTNVRGCPLPELSDGYLGLCSFACNHGYCPETACTTKCEDD